MQKVMTTYEHPDVISQKILSDDKNRTNISYEDYVKMGKEILKSIDCYQARVAFYACQVCVIRHGGKSDKYYTLTDYSASIGMSHNTLSNWTLIYRNVIERLGIPLEEITKRVWTTASRTNERITDKNRRVNVDKETKRKNIKYNKEVSLEGLRQFYKEESNDTPSFHSEFRHWNSTVMNIKNNIPKRDLNLIHEGDVLELMRNLDIASDIINDFLTVKKKKAKH